MLTEIVKRDCPGYAIGGLSGGEEKDKFWRMVHLSTSLLPRDKPRYLMGVGLVKILRFTAFLVITFLRVARLLGWLYPFEFERDSGNPLSYCSVGRSVISDSE